MKKTLLSIAAGAMTSAMMAAGWPANYDGVMLQGFYWDSFSESKWTTMTSKADLYSQYFNLIWVPNSGNCKSSTAMGYSPIYWFNQSSAFGNETTLRTMIQTYKAKGTGIIEDVVINHKNGANSWCDFPTETWNGHTISWSMSDICRNDEAASNGFNVTGNYDTGENFDGCRDLDHTSSNVQNNIKIYLDYLKNDLGYIGFRYDMVKGFGSQYIKMYNQSSKPTYSVGEYWDGDYNAVANWIKGTGYESAAFDFPLKYIMNDAFGNGNWGALANKGLAGDPNINRYSVTFVDNHDTYRDHNALRNNVLAANAFILAMPGTPCVFMPHFNQWQKQIGDMIKARRAAGINNQSSITEQGTQGGGYVIKVKGTKGSVMMIAGYVANANTAGFKLVSSGDNYAYFVSDGIDINTGGNTGGGGDPTPDPDPVEKKDIKVYVNAPSAPYVYAWDVASLSAEWPGDLLSNTTTTADGKTWYTTTYNCASLNIVLNDGNGTKTDDITDITSDELYLQYDGATTYTDVTSTYAGQGGGDTPTPDPDPTPDPEKKDINVYVKASNAPYVYAWDVAALSAAWPGDLLSKTTTTSDGTTWYTTTYNCASLNIVLNNGNGVQTADITGITSDIYLEYDGAETVNDLTSQYAGGGTPTPDPTPDPVEGINVFVNAQVAPYLYAWNSTATLSSAWPGDQLSKTTTTTDGLTWYTTTFSTAELNLVLNNGNGTQTADITGITSDIYIKYDGGTGYTDVTSQYTGGGDTPEPGNDLPECATYIDGKLFLYFEGNSTYTEPNAWIWNDFVNFTGGTWPGTKLTEVGTAANGNKVYQWNGGDLDEANMPTGIVFSTGTGAPQTDDIAYTNGGYYNAAGALIGIVTKSETPDPVYDPADVNHDGTVDVTDVNIIINAMLSGEYSAMNDVDGDGTIDVTDVNLVINTMLGTK